MLSGSSGGQFVSFPQLVNDLLLLHRGGDLLLLQVGAGLLHGEDALVLLLGFPLGTGLGSFRFSPKGQDALKLLLHGFLFRFVFRLTKLQPFQFPGDPLIVLVDDFHQSQLLFPVTLHSGAQLLQVRNVGKCGGTLSIQSSLRRFQSRHFFGNGSGGFCRLALASFQSSQADFRLLQLLGKDLNLRLLSGITLPVRGIPCQQSFFFPLGRSFRFHDGI